ncbi:MAG: hypothetical protein GXY44_16090, partial [Phycisphaerales bacterium]|nr:hypothetical protein [Phycisphaerales bacterium]
MNRVQRNNGRPRRRATVLVLVVGILALLFIIGATSLLMMRFERQSVYTHATVRNLDAVAAALMNPVIAQLRKDIVGEDGIPYNRGWGGDTSQLEDYADFPGYRSDPTDPNERFRQGDLLLSSIEPYYDGTHYRWPFLSWGYDAVLNPAAAPAEGLLRDVPIHITGGPGLDVSGDGLRDGIEDDVFAGLSAMFGGNYRTRIRVIPHGGMVLLDRYTHPALLSQVIHPRDGVYHNNPGLLWTTGGLIPDPLNHESDLRRRYFLPPKLKTPPQGQNYAYTAPTIVQLLPVTLGYANPANPGDWVNNPIEHWWPIDDSLVEGDADWWKQRLIAGPALTDQSYSAANDRYDRRRLLTTLNSDDIL